MQLPLYGLVAASSTLIPPFAGAFRFKQLDFDLKIFYALTMFNALWVLGQFITVIMGKNNIWMSHVYVYLELLTFLELYRRWDRSELGRSIIILTMIGYSLFWLASKVFYENFLTPSLYASPTSRVLLVVSSIYAMYLLARDSMQPLHKEPRFWISATTLIYAAGAVMFYALQAIINRMPMDQIVNVYYVYWSFTILIQLSYCWVFLCKSSRVNSGGRLVSAL